MTEIYMETNCRSMYIGFQEYVLIERLLCENVELI